MEGFHIHNFLMNKKVFHHATVNDTNLVVPTGFCLSEESHRTWSRP